jgi:hypothetical protein
MKNISTGRTFCRLRFHSRYLGDEGFRGGCAEGNLERLMSLIPTISTIFLSHSQDHRGCPRGAAHITWLPVIVVSQPLLTASTLEIKSITNGNNHPFNRPPPPPPPPPDPCFMIDNVGRDPECASQVRPSRRTDVHRTSPRIWTIGKEGVLSSMHWTALSAW